MIAGKRRITSVVDHGTQFRGRCRGVEVGMLSHLPVIVLGCGKEDPSWLDKSAFALIFAALQTPKPPLHRRKPADPRLPPKNPAKEGCTGWLGVVARGRSRLVHPRGPLFGSPWIKSQLCRKSDQIHHFRAIIDFGV